MTPVHCRVKHDPPNSYSDCLRACVASVLDMKPEDVPNFADDLHNTGANGINLRIMEFLKPLGYAPFWTGYPGDSTTFEDLMEHLKEFAPGVPIIFYCRSGAGDHVVIVQDGKIAHDPAWYRSPIVGPNTLSNAWVTLVVCKV